MEGLIKNIEDLKRHIVVSASFDFAKVLPYAKRAQRKIIVKLFGREQYQEFCDHVFVDGGLEPINLVRELLEEAVAHYALILAMPTINLLITNAGTKSTNTTESSNADWKEKRDLNRTLYQTYNEALDEAFEIMEANPDDFTSWKDSDHYTVFKDLLVFQTNLFNDHFDIQNNRQTFQAAKSLMGEIEDQYLLRMLGQCTLDFLKVKSTEPTVLNAQKIARKATVALTVSKAAEYGGFSFTETSMTVRMEVLPWEKTFEISPEKLSSLQVGKQTAGENYLKDLKKIILANPEIFTCYQDKIETGISKQIIKKKSGLFL